jgi:hypothetical protein
MVGKLSLRYCLLNNLKLRYGHPMIAEVHREKIAKPTSIIIPNTLEAERMVLMMNANLPAFLWYMFIKHEAEENVIKTPLTKSCKATLRAEMYKCKWDAATRTFTMVEEEKRVNDMKALKSAQWFRDEFELLGKEKKGKQYVAPEALFNLGNATSQKTIQN